VRRSTGWRAEGKTDAWEPLELSPVRSKPPQNPGPVGDWLEAITKNREPECSGRNGAWAVEMVMGVYHAALSGKRVSFPLSIRSHALS